MGAKVGEYLAVLAESSTRGLLRRKAQMASRLKAARFERRPVHQK